MKAKFHIKKYFIYIIWLFLYINCNKRYKENSNILNKSNSCLLFSFNEYDNNMDTDFDPEIIDKTINIGEVQNEILYTEKIYKFNVDLSNSNNEGDLLVHFYPLDCKIKIVAKNENNDNIPIKQINNYDYNIFYAIIKKDQLKSAYFKIMPLINQLDITNKYRDFHLIINSFENNNNPQLFLKEKVPTPIYFSKDFTKIKILYNLKDKNYKNSVAFSFFIKERDTFEVEILDGENPNRIIGYIDNIIINPETLSKQYNSFYLSINKMNNNKDSTMIIKVIENNKSSFYFQKNILNLGFMPINHSNHYYYLKIYNGEEGEIMLHSKRLNGILIGKIVEIKNINEFEVINNINIFPNNKKKDEFLNNIDYLQFNEHSQELSFNSSQTNKCIGGCYLLINYYCPDFGMDNIEGSEYTLLSRVWDEQEYKSQIIFIPLNEYIFGTFEEININMKHYYSVYIPEDNNLIVEIQGSNIKALAREGIIKINIFKNNVNNIDLIKEEEEKIIYKLNRENLGIKTFKNHYISFAFYYNSPFYDYYSEKIYSNYYFRILQQNSNMDYMIYPLDTNKANICQTSIFRVNHKDYNWVCFFLLKNDYKELNYNSYIYANGIRETNYNAWFVNQSDYYSIDIQKIRSSANKKNQTNGYLSIYGKKEVNYILVEIISNSKEKLSVLFNFNAKFLLSPSLDIFSYQAFFLLRYRISDIYFNFNIFNEYRVFIEFIRGEGYIYLKDNYDEEKKYLVSKGMIVSLIASETNNNIHIDLEDRKNLFFKMKIYNQIHSDLIEEIQYGFNPKSNNKEKLITYYYINDIYNKGIDINFFFEYENKNDIKYLDIKGYTVDYQKIKYITIEEDLLYYLEYEYPKEPIQGYFDIGSKSGLITFDKEKSNKMKYKDINKYYLITISNINENNDLEYFNFSLKIQVNPKNSPHYIIPINKYIRGSFDLLNNSEIQSQKFYVKVEDNDDEDGEDGEENKTNIENIYILEFSSNYKNIKLIFNNEFNYYKKTIYNGFQQYFFSSKNLTNDTNYFFIVQIDNKNMENVIKNKFINKVNYILKFYKEEDELSQNYIINKEPNFTFINSTSENISYYNLNLKNNYKISNESDYYNYTYLVRLYLKKYIYEDQQLNTTALISYNYDLDYYYNYYEEITDDPNKEISCNFSDLLFNEEYILYLFVKINGKNEKEKYYSNYFNINTKPKKEENKSEDNNRIFIIIILSISLFVIIIIFIIVTIICIRIRNKKKSLEEKVNAISFSTGIDSDEIENDNKKSKKDEDYETTFI